MPSVSACLTCTGVLSISFRYAYTVSMLGASFGITQVSIQVVPPPSFGIVNATSSPSGAIEGSPTQQPDPVSQTSPRASRSAMSAWSPVTVRTCVFLRSIRKSTTSSS
jgi:hypothetical protein